MSSSAVISIPCWTATLRVFGGAMKTPSKRDALTGSSGTVVVAPPARAIVA